MMRAFGMKNVKVLDGGFAKWKAEGNPIVANSRGASTAADFDFKLDGSVLASFE